MSYWPLVDAITGSRQERTMRTVRPGMQLQHEPKPVMPLTDMVLRSMFGQTGQKAEPQADTMLPGSSEQAAVFEGEVGANWFRRLFPSANTGTGPRPATVRMFGQQPVWRARRVGY